MKDLLKIKNLIKNHIVDHNQLAECGSCRCIYKIDSFKDYIIKVPINKEGEKEINFEIKLEKEKQRDEYEGITLTRPAMYKDICRDI